MFIITLFNMKINANELLISACVLQNLVLQVSNDLWLQELSLLVWTVITVWWGVTSSVGVGLFLHWCLTELDRSCPEWRALGRWRVTREASCERAPRWIFAAGELCLHAEQHKTHTLKNCSEYSQFTADQECPQSTLHAFCFKHKHPAHRTRGS